MLFLRFPPMNQYGPPPGEYFAPEMDPYYHSYEPPQDANWGGPVRNCKFLFVIFPMII